MSLTKDNDKLPKLDSQLSVDEDAHTPMTPDVTPEVSDPVTSIEDEYVLPQALRPEPQPGRPNPQQQIHSLKKKLDHKDKHIAQAMDAYRKAKKDIDNVQERVKQAERKRFEQLKGDFIAQFVEVLDNLDRAIESIEKNFDSDAILQGIIFVRSRLVQLLREEGLEKIFVSGQQFDPQFCEATEMATVGNQSQDKMILRELQRGYMLKGSLLRPARVVVGRFANPHNQTPPSPQDPTPSSRTPPETTNLSPAAIQPTKSIPLGIEDAPPDETLKLSQDGQDDLTEK